MEGYRGKGSTFMCNCNLGLHRAGVPEPDHYRDLIQIQFAPSSNPLPKDWFKDFVDLEEPIRMELTKNKSRNVRPAD